MKLKLLFAENYLAMTSKNVVLRDPSNFLEFLYTNYPQHKQWITPEVFKQYQPWPKDYIYTEGEDMASNITGCFIKSNLQTQVDIIEGRCTVKKLACALKKNKYTHVAFSVFSSDFSEFIRCTEYIRHHYPKIKIIAGNIGALFEGTDKYVDYVCRERGVPYLRNLFDEDQGKPFKSAYSPYEYDVCYKDNKIRRYNLLVVTKIGCPHRCDFCSTNKYFKGKHSKELVSPNEVHDAILEHRRKLGNKNFNIHMAEPTAIINKNWWYELFELFEQEKGDYPVIAATTTNSLRNLDFERLSNSAMRFEMVYIGVEDFNRTYNKNDSIDIQELIDMLIGYGIGVYTSYIIGFPHQTLDEIWDGVKQFADLHPTWWEVHNLKVYPGSPFWNKIKRDDRYVDIPLDFRCMHGFQQFKDENFRIGFADLWPLMYEIQRYIEAANGPIVTNLCKVYKNLIKTHDINNKLFRRTLQWYKAISKEIFPVWKLYFEPNTYQKENYLEKSQIA
ncbi:MAG: B12-binding domain-containing radical SAM protein [Candidatus Hodarchaeota archaeon]